MQYSWIQNTVIEKDGWGLKLPVPGKKKAVDNNTGLAEEST